MSFCQCVNPLHRRQNLTKNDVINEEQPSQSNVDEPILEMITSGTQSTAMINCQDTSDTNSSVREAEGNCVVHHLNIFNSYPDGIDSHHSTTENTSRIKTNKEYVGTMNIGANSSKLNTVQSNQCDHLAMDKTVETDIVLSLRSNHCVETSEHVEDENEECHLLQEADVSNATTKLKQGDHIEHCATNHRGELSSLVLVQVAQPQSAISQSNQTHGPEAIENQLHRPATASQGKL